MSSLHWDSVVYGTTTTPTGSMLGSFLNDHLQVELRRPSRTSFVEQPLLGSKHLQLESNPTADCQQNYSLYPACGVVPDETRRPHQDHLRARGGTIFSKITCGRARAASFLLTTRHGRPTSSSSFVKDSTAESAFAVKNHKKHIPSCSSSSFFEDSVLPEPRLHPRFPNISDPNASKAELSRPIICYPALANPIRNEQDAMDLATMIEKHRKMKQKALKV
ncbi:unnamed protein product [Amoebophrya sp. A25]|nr:unnamed protein product [Amoebophrya sp. A25]|eukprot:GSA25T00026029001.1